MPTQDRRKSPDTEIEGKNLNKLLQLINVPASKQQLPSISHKQCQVENISQWPLPQPSTGSTQTQSSESKALEKFSCKYKNERNFSRHPHHKLFLEIFSSLVRQRLCCVDWVDRAPPESILRLITCLRILMRDPSYQKKFTELGGLQVLSDDFKKATDSYLRYRDNPYVVDILKEMTNIFQKLSHVKEQRELLIDCNAHTSLVLLLSARDVIVLHCSLHALIQLTESERPRQIIGEMNTIEILLRIIREYDSLSKKLAAKLLQCLCHDSESRENIQQYDGVPILLSQLQSDNVNLLKHVIWCLVQLCEDHNASKEIRQLGGIPLILSLLQPEREFVTERSENSEGLASAGPHGRTPIVDEASMDSIHTAVQSGKAEELMEQEYSLKSACCAALTELVMNDANAQQIAQANGIYSLGLLILPAERKCSDKERKLVKNLQRNAFRALRFLFSMERNRRLFKSLFPPDLFELFINIGHYNRDLKDYKSLVEKINSLSSEVVREIKMNIKETNQNKEATRYIGEFEVFELLGKGAFGSVYKVKKKTTVQSFLALKEVNIEDPAFGKNSRERDQSVGDIINELSIIREQMKHPNVVKYYKTFVDGERLYIVMELIEGAPLAEHFNSLKEKKETFPETRVWDILMQLVLALRYLHKEKEIVHRDLTPNNIMLGENDKVTITDFGLAKQKRSDCSKMTSVVGTILYSCPEVVQNLPYGEKADIWALGCIIYQMCTLQPPFFSNNMLTLVTKIVEAKYDSITSNEYTPRLKEVIKTCICPSPDKRPDILELAGQMTDKLLVHMDTLRVNKHSMERKLEKERRKTQRYYFEENQNKKEYHRMCRLSNEKYAQLANLAGSGGAEELKDGEIIDPSSVDIEMLRNSGSVYSSEFRQGFLEQNDREWTSDDDYYVSSGSESRESSAGSTRSSTLTQGLPKPPMTPKMSRRDRGFRTNNNVALSPLSLSPLSLDIPNSAKTSRDSGISSGDPSPNNSHLQTTSVSSIDPLLNGHLQAVACRKFHRSQSTPTINNAGRKKKPKRPNSANTPTVTISQKKVRQISDPIQQMLHQLHKIIFISQMPPTLCPDQNRRMIDRFKRALFAQQTSTFNLKNELKKLMMGSRDIIDINLGPIENKRIGSASSAESESLEGDRLTTNQYDPDCKEAGITYEHMQSMIESTLIDCGYYNMTPSSRERTPPLGPIGSSRNVPLTIQTHR